jgi:acyl-CoA reductase-like NAD-dependent aldehyde dehydrogenase
MAESRRDELSENVSLAEGLKTKEAKATVARSIDRIVWHAGWTDKIAQILGSSNPVAGPYFNFSVPVPSGVVGVIADQDSSLEAFLDAVLAPIAVGNSVVVIASERRPTPSILVSEMTATADFPGGVLNVLTGFTGELAPTLAGHDDVDGLDLAGVDEAFGDDLAQLAAGSIKRVLRPSHAKETSLRRLRAFVETSTVWHTIGQ